VRTPNTNRIAFGIVSVLARTIDAYERLDVSRGIGPRASSRWAASASVSPVGTVWGAVVAMRRRYTAAGSRTRAIDAIG
jgi:hypothetical protein